MPWLIGGSIAAGVGGTTLAALGQVQAGAAAAAQARSQQAISQFNAQVQEQEAKARRAATQFEQERQAKEADRVGGRLRALLSASGVVPSAGTPLLLQAEQAAESELENLLIGFEGRTGVQRARSKAELDRLQAGVFGQRAGFARRAGRIGAGTTLLTGLGGAAIGGAGFFGGGGTPPGTTSIAGFRTV